MTAFIMSILICSFSFASHFIPRSFSGEVTQVVEKVRKRKGKEIKREIKTNISLKYLFPKNYMMRTPVNTYMCNESNVWIYSPPHMSGEKGELSVGASRNYCFSKVFDAISTGLRKNKIYKYKIEDKLITFNFSSKAQKSLGFKKMLFKFEDKVKDDPRLSDVKELNIHYVDAVKPALVLKIKKISTDEKLSSADFVFKVPKNTNISKLK